MPVTRFILLCAPAISMVACGIDTRPPSEPPTGTIAASATSVLEGSDQEPKPARRVTDEAAMGDNSLTISPEQISLDIKSLPYIWKAMVVPEMPEENRRRPGVYGLPEHIEIYFYALGGRHWKHGDPVMYIIPLNAYQTLRLENDSTTVTRAVEGIQDLISSFPDHAVSAAIPAHIPALPDEQTLGRANDIAVHLVPAQVSRTSNLGAAKQGGYRLVGRWVETPDPVTNKDLWYVYQGISSDSAYLILFWYTVSVPGLPDDLDGLLAEQIEHHFEDDPVASLMTVAEELNNLPADRWQPDLAILDAVISSLEIEDGSNPENQ